MHRFLLLCGIVCCCATTRCYWNTRWDVSFLLFAGFNCLDFYIRWIQHVWVFLHIFLLLCGIVCCCVTTRCWSVRQMFVSIRASLHLKIILTGNYAWPKFRWIQLSWFLDSLDSTCCSLAASFLVVMWHCLLLCNYKLFLKHKVGCGFFFAGFDCLDLNVRWIQHVLVFLQIFLLLCGFVCCCVTTRCYWNTRWDVSFLLFAGFNCLDFYIRWIQHVLVFLQIFLLLCGFVCCCETTRCYWNTRWDVSFLFSMDLIVLISKFAGFNMFSLFAKFLVVMWLCLLLCNYKMFLKHKVGCRFFRWIRLSWFECSLDSTCFSLFAKFLVIVWLCLLLCNYKMFLKHKVGCFFSSFRWIQLSWFLYSLDSTCFSLFAFLHRFLLLCGIVCCCATTRCYWNTRWDVSFLLFAGFNCLDFYIRWIQHVWVFLHIFLLLCGIVGCCVTTRCWSVRQMFVSIRVSLHLKIILTGNYAWPKFRWIQLSWFLDSLDSTCFSLFANFLVVMWLCLLLWNYKMLLKHKVGCFFSFFAGFNCLDLNVRWIQHVLVFLQSFLLLCGFVCCCVTTRCFWNTRWDVSFLFFAGFNCLDF